MHKARARRERELRRKTSRETSCETSYKTSLSVLVGIALFHLLGCWLGVLPAKAMPRDEKNNDRLWADEILYEGTARHFRAQGEVRLQVHRNNGRILILTDRLDYDGTEGTVRAQGGNFGKGRNRKTQGALRLHSGEVIFFQYLETDDSLQPLKGEGLGWRGTERHGGLSAATFHRRKRKRHKQDDWIFNDIRYTRCPICADALAKQEQRDADPDPDPDPDADADADATNDEQETKQRSSQTPPLWRVDATRMRWERFEGKKHGWFGEVPRIHLHNPRLNIYGVPIFYSPYLSFPRNGVRASGLLPPRYGQNSQRGWYVALPLYWAPHRGWDVTYVPIFATKNRDASRFETRAAWSAGGTKDTEQASPNASTTNANTTSANTTSKVEHLFDATASWSLPHGQVGSGADAQFFAFGKMSWRAPWGLRADALYHGVGDRLYLRNYGQGVDIFSTSAPSSLTDHARIEHFSRNGYARLTLEEQRELLTVPRADAMLLPELVYNNGGTFARSQKGGGSWKIESLWRGAAQDAQQAIDTVIEEQEAFRQDLVSAAVALEWRENLPFSFVSRTAFNLATTYWHDTQEGDAVLFLPEFQQSFEGLFAKSSKKGKRTLYLRPMLEFYATLDDDSPPTLRDTLHDKVGGRATFYETGARLGDRLAFDSTLEGGQRLLVAAELGVRGAQGSSAALFAAPTLLRQKRDDLSGRLWTGARASWKDRLSFAYDTTWELPNMRLLSQRAEAETKGEFFTLTLAYKEFRAFDSPSFYEQDITVESSLRLRQRWQFDLSAGYGFLGHSVPIGFSLTYKGSCVTLKLSYDRTIYSDREDSESYNASLRFDFS